MRWISRIVLHFLIHRALRRQVNAAEQFHRGAQQALRRRDL